MAENTSVATPELVHQAWLSFEQKVRRKGGLPSRDLDEGARLALKTLASEIARAASQQVADRHSRMAAKAQIYSHLLPLFDHQARTELARRRTLHLIIRALAAVSLAA